MTLTASADDTWLRGLYDEHWASMVRLATLLLGSSDHADEVVQDVLVAIFRHRDRLQGSPLGGYLRRAVVNGCRSVMRHRVVVLMHQQAPELVTNAADQRLLASERNASVMAALRHLPQRQQEVLVLRYYSDLSEQEISDALGISRGSVKSHASRGLQGLRMILEKEGTR
jgi:RNA polymerase sigma-70 factor (sigma-E family)